MQITSHYLVADPNPGLNAAQLQRARKAVIARENAKRSTGPTTPEGKAKSAQNARKHGFSGAAIVIADEDREAFDAHLDAYFDSFQPICQSECDMVRKIAVSQWRYDRLLAVETGLLDLELTHRKPTVDAFLDNVENHHYLAIAFMELTNATDALELCRRYLNQASRENNLAIRTFYLMKENRPKPEPVPPAPAVETAPEPQQNQPEPNEPTSWTPPHAPSTASHPADRPTEPSKGHTLNGTGARGTV